MEHGHVEIYLLNVLIFHSDVKLPAGKLHMMSDPTLSMQIASTQWSSPFNCQVKVSEVAGSLSAAETSIIFKCPVVDHSLLLSSVGKWPGVYVTGLVLLGKSTENNTFFV